MPDFYLSEKTVVREVRAMGVFVENDPDWKAADGQGAPIAWEDLLMAGDSRARGKYIVRIPRIIEARDVTTREVESRKGLDSVAHDVVDLIPLYPQILKALPIIQAIADDLKKQGLAP
jgi:hypothetical protein